MKNGLKCFILFFILIFFLIGCGNIIGSNSQIPDKNTILKYVKNISPSENIGLYDEFVDKSGDFDKYIYLFKSNDRDLSFKIIATVSNQSDGIIPNFDGEISDTYREEVKKIYKPSIDNSFMTSNYFKNDESLYFNGFLEITSYSQIKDVINIICNISEKYTEELYFNNSYFLENTFTDLIFIKYFNGSDYINLASIAPNGILTKEEINKEIFNQIDDCLIKNNLNIPK